MHNCIVRSNTFKKSNAVRLMSTFYSNFILLKLTVNMGKVCLRIKDSKESSMVGECITRMNLKVKFLSRIARIFLRFESREFKFQMEKKSGVELVDSLCDLCVTRTAISQNNCTNDNEDETGCTRGKAGGIQKRLLYLSGL